MSENKFTVKEVASYIGCSEASIRKMVRESIIPHYRIYSKILFDKQKIDSWLNEKTILKRKEN